MRPSSLSTVFLPNQIGQKQNIKMLTNTSGAFFFSLKTAFLSDGKSGPHSVICTQSFNVGNQKASSTEQKVPLKRNAPSISKHIITYGVFRGKITAACMC